MKDPFSASSLAGARVYALRQALGLSQAEFSARGLIDRAVLSRIETGGNKCSTAAVRTALARAAGVPREVLSGYLEGTITIRETLDARNGTLSTPEPPAPARDASVRAALALVEETFVRESPRWQKAAEALRAVEEELRAEFRARNRELFTVDPTSP